MSEKITLVFNAQPVAAACKHGSVNQYRDVKLHQILSSSGAGALSFARDR